MTDFKRVFIDMAPIIYFLENSSLYMESMSTFFAKMSKGEYKNCYFNLNC